MRASLLMSVAGVQAARDLHAQVFINACFGKRGFVINPRFSADSARTSGEIIEGHPFVDGLGIETGHRVRLVCARKRAARR
jgi:hypothetical protein